MEISLLEMQNRIRQLKMEKDACFELFSTYATVMVDTNEKMSKLMRERDNLKVNIDTNVKNIALKDKLIEKLNGEVETLESNLSLLKDKLKEMEETYSEEKDRLSEEIKNEFESEISRLENELAEEKERLEKEKAKDKPGMAELKEQIRKTQDLLEENTGKKKRSENSKILTQKEIYYLKHHLIELRKQQYYLMDSVVQTMPPPQNKAEYFSNIIDLQMNYKVYPRGTMRGENDIEFKTPRIERNYGGAATDIEKEISIKKENNKPYFNFLDKEHIYYLILNYWDIRAAIQEIPDSPLWNLLWTLDFYIEKANLNEQQTLIVRDKKLRLLNKEIAKDLMNELGIYHQENYISTIWNKITQQIADAAELNYDEWLSRNYDKCWKKCNTCGKELLRDPRNFVRKTKAPDGLTNKCKCCDRITRQGRK